MHRVFNLYEISDGSGLLAIEDEKGVPGDLCLIAVSLIELRATAASAVKPDTYEFKLADRETWVDIKKGSWTHGIPPSSQILSYF